MQSLHSCKRTLGHRRGLTAQLNAFHSGLGSQPPVATPLDLVLQKAANKVKLAHPAAQDVKKTKAKEPNKRPTPCQTASRTQPKQRVQKRPSHPVDDDALLNDITESERNSVWEAFKLEVEADSDDEDWLQDPDDGTFGHRALPAQHRRAPSSARDDLSSNPSLSALTSLEPIASTSAFKGFGAPPRRPPQAAPGAPGPRIPRRGDVTTPTQTAYRRAPSHSHKALPAAAVHPDAALGTQLSPQPERQAASRQGDNPGTLGSPPFRVFLFNAEEARTRSLLQQLGLATRVRVVDDLRCADAVLAAKLTRSGKHVNLTQGERTAANLGIPFLVVGRHISADNLRAALMAVLDPQQQAATAGAVAATSPQGPDGVATAATRACRSPTAAELQAHRLEVMHGFAQMLRQGGVAQQPGPVAAAAPAAAVATDGTRG